MYSDLIDDILGSVFVIPILGSCNDIVSVDYGHVVRLREVWQSRGKHYILAGNQYSHGRGEKHRKLSSSVITLLRNKRTPFAGN